MKTGYQGIDGAFSSIAARKLSPKSAEYIGFPDFFGVFRALEENLLDNIVIPLENSTAGRVADPHRLIAKHDVHFHAEYILKVEHNLVVKPGTKLEDIHEIHSHEQAIMQCERKIKQIFEKINPSVRLVKMEDTAISAKNTSLQQGNSIAGIASLRAAEIYNLDILIPKVQDVDENFTSFVLISKIPNKQAGISGISYITSMIFEVGNQPGSLVIALNALYKNRIDITKIESYIPGIKSNKAQFFLSCMGHCDDLAMKNALNEIKSVCNWIKIFGSYPADLKRL